MEVRCMITELTCNHNTHTHCYFSLRYLKNNSQLSTLPPGLEKVRSLPFDWRAGEQSSHPSLLIPLTITRKTRASPMLHIKLLIWKVWPGFRSRVKMPRLVTRLHHCCCCECMCQIFRHNRGSTLSDSPPFCQVTITLQEDSCHNKLSLFLSFPFTHCKVWAAFNNQCCKYLLCSVWILVTLFLIQAFLTSTILR